MNRILWLNLFRKEGMKVLVIIAYYLISVFAVDSLSDISINFGHLLIIHSVILSKSKAWDEMTRKLSEGLFLLPISFQERKTFAMKRICMEWTIEGLLGAVLLAHTCISVRKNLIFPVTREGIVSYILLLILILSCIHMLSYVDYMKENDAWEYIPVAMALGAKTVLLTVTFYMGDKFFTIYSLFYYMFFIPLIYMDYKIAKKHFAKMVSFYADYEYSRGIKKFEL